MAPHVWGLSAADRGRLRPGRVARDRSWRADFILQSRGCSVIEEFKQRSDMTRQ